MKKRFEWLNFFESDDQYKEPVVTPSSIKDFIIRFRTQPLRYKAVWIIRILLWGILTCIAIFGAVTGIIR